MFGKVMAAKCAENYRALRKKGITIRKTADVIIASFCIEKRMPLLFLDHDFTPYLTTALHRISCYGLALSCRQRLSFRIDSKTGFEMTAPFQFKDTDVNIEKRETVYQGFFRINNAAAIMALQWLQMNRSRLQQEWYGRG